VFAFCLCLFCAASCIINDDDSVPAAAKYCNYSELKGGWNTSLPAKPPWLSG